MTRRCISTKRLLCLFYLLREDIDWWINRHYGGYVGTSMNCLKRSLVKISGPIYNGNPSCAKRMVAFNGAEAVAVRLTQVNDFFDKSRFTLFARRKTSTSSPFPSSSFCSPSFALLLSFFSCNNLNYSSNKMHRRATVDKCVTTQHLYVATSSQL